MNVVSSQVTRYRSIWISDVHLGTRGCQAEMLLDFLKYTESEYLYLVGDIIDGWHMKRTWYWRQAHNDVIQKLLRKARKGTRLIYIPGNHDENFQAFCGRRFGRMVILREAVHKTATGKKFVVIHGDQFDGVIKYAKWLAVLGDGAYTWALSLNTGFNILRRKMGFSYWSLSAYLKHKVKNAVEYISRFEDAVIADVRKKGKDGVICGHIHHAEIRDIDGYWYGNCGDWVESCTALVEHPDGRFEIIHWAEHQSSSLVEKKTCESSSSPTPGFLKSMVLSVRSIL